jgi:hypothetical protein
MMIDMRTTLTLDPEVARMIEEEVHRRRQPFRKVVNDALRRGLSPRPPIREGKPYRLRPHKARLLPGLDPGSLNRLADDLEVQATIDKRRSR